MLSRADFLVRLQAGVASKGELYVADLGTPHGAGGSNSGTSPPAWRALILAPVAKRVQAGARSSPNFAIRQERRVRVAHCGSAEAIATSLGRRWPLGCYGSTDGTTPIILDLQQLARAPIIPPRNPTNTQFPYQPNSLQAGRSGVAGQAVATLTPGSNRSDRSGRAAFANQAAPCQL